jgi:hypothetical protein
MRQCVSRNRFWIFATTILVFAIALQGCASSPGVGPVTITQTSLPNGRVNAPYSVTLTATGGVAPYRWAVASGALPAGLTLDPNSGVLSGTPTQTVSMDLLTIRVSDSSTASQSFVATLALTVVGAANITITPAALPNGQVGVAYSQTLTATGGTAPYTWAVSGTLPAGLSFSTSTGAITGTPTASVNAAPLKFTVTDTSNPVLTQTANLTLTIVPANLVITTTSLPTGEVGAAYSATLAATGGTTPYSWSLTSGTLPAGLLLNAATGTITGTPTAATGAPPLTLTFTVTDAGSPPLAPQTKSVNLTLTVISGLTITTASLPNAQVNVPYSTTLAATGGTGPYTWSVAAGTLPAGLTLNAATGAITGTPTAAVNATPLTFKVADSFSPPQTKTANLALTVFAGLGIITTSLPNGQVGVPYSTTLTAAGGTPPYTWSLTSGTLDGLTLNAATGVISGIPTAAVTASPLTFTVTDAFTPPQSKPANLTLTILPALAITTASLPNGQVGVAYNAMLAATGGATPYTWSLVSGSLDGLTLNAATGAITGLPTAAVTASPLTFQVTDSSAPTPVSKTVNLTLTIAGALTITTTTLPAGQVGTVYSATLAATGGVAPYTWSLVSGSLDGLALNAATGAITGTPTAAVTASPLTFQVTDSSAPTPVSKTAALTLTVVPTLAITTTTLPAGQVGVAYSATLAATGGVTPYTWSLTSGSLDGLALNAATGAITGTPTAAVTASPLTFQVTDSSAPTPVSKTVNLTLTVAGALTITTTTLPTGQVGVAYSATLAASGGVTPYTWSVASGSLDGLTLDALSGTISGMPTAAVTNSMITFKVTDSTAPTPVSKTATIALTIAPMLAITTTTLPAGQVGVAYSATLAATGGVTPYTWTKTAGSLDGLSLDAASGAITGMPTVAVTNAMITFKVTDSSTPTPVAQTVTLSLTVVAGLTITTSSLPNGQVGVAYSATLAATGGVTPYTWTRTGGSLDGLSLDPATGIISGMPTAAVTGSMITFKVTDSSTPTPVTQIATLSLTIVPALAITTSSLPSGQVGVAYNATLAATGGVLPYTWSLISGSLDGLTLNAATGAITGMPTAAMPASPLTFQVTDSTTPTPVSKTVPLTLTVTPANLSITTTSLPDAVINTPYSEQLTAAGGVPPYTWALVAGTFPDPALSLDPSTGIISGTPTTLAFPTSLTFQVTDSATPTAGTQQTTLTLAIDPFPLVVVLTADERGATLNQTVNLTATVPSDKGNAGVTWSVTGTGTLTGQTKSAAAFQASTANVYTITATSIAHKNQSASITVGVTDLPAVATFHNNLSRDGANTKEYALTTANVTAPAFGKLFSCSADAAIYAQPLWVANANIGGGTHNVLVAATMHDSVYAFDADANPCVTYWNQHLVPSNETWGSSSDVGSSDIFPDIGIAGTPVIDTTSNTVYLVTKTKTASGTYHQRLHVLNLADGTERPNSPVEITDSITTSGTCDSSGTVTFNARTENQQAGLALVNGIVYISWASHSDSDPYHGWIAGYDASSLSLVGVFNASPNLAEGKDYCRAGVRMYGGAPAADANNNLYFVTGNGTFDANSGGSNFGDSVMKLSTSKGLSVADWFTPHNQQNLDSSGQEGGAAILVDQPSAPNARLLISAGKEGVISVLSRDSLGHFNSTSDQVLQRFNANQAAFSTPSFWQDTLYYAGAGGNASAYAFDVSTGLFNTTPSSTSTATFGYPGATPSISSLESTNGIVWALDSSNFGTDDTGSRAAGPAILHAYDAANLGRELWNSSQGSGNAAGNAVKYAVPTIANGKVYIGTRGNDTTQGSGSVFGELDVYGLKPN